MAEYLIQDTTLTAIADAVRSKTGETASMTISEIATAISNIKVSHPNGTEWTQSNLTNVTVNFLEYNNYIWIAGMSGNGLYYSTNGKIWTQSNLSSETIYFLKYANGIWVAGSNMGLYYSTNGIEWIQSNINTSFAPSTYLYYADGLWIIYGSETYHRYPYYSYDGKTWTQLSSNLQSYCIKKDNGVWIMGSSANEGLFYSMDGITYTNSNINTGYFRDVCYKNGIWVASGTTGLYYSTDGMTWAQTNMSTSKFHYVNNINNIWYAYDNGSTDSTTPGLYYSTDGIVWNKTNMPENYYCYYYIFYGNGKWIAGSEGTGLYYSTDGINWIACNLPETYIDTPCYANGIWIASRLYGGSCGIYYSIDGINWIKCNYSSLGLIKYTNNIWLAAGTHTNSGISYSVSWE